MGYIYALADPKDGRIRYVGKTNQPYTRFKTHLRGDVRPDHPKAKWLQSLKEQGLQPSLIILEEVADEDINACEQEWVRRFAVTGTELTNMNLIQSIDPSAHEDSDRYRLLVYMRSNGLSNGEMSTRMKLTPSYISHLTGGKREITDAFRWRFFEVFGKQAAFSVFNVATESLAA